MKKYSLVLIIIMLLFPVFTFAEVSSTMSTKIQEIWIYLNHQNFQKAQELQKELLSNISLDILSKELSYTDFITLIQTVSWDIKWDDFPELFLLREKYHPENSNNAALLTRKDRNLFWEDCIANNTILLDFIDSAMCIAYSNNFPLTLKKIILKSFTSRYYHQVLNWENLQDMSDFGNFITVYISIDPTKKLLYSTYQKRIGFQIIKKDPSWVNWYFFLISNSKTLMEKNKWIDQLTKNYLWDKERWKQVVVPFIDSYN